MYLFFQYGGGLQFWICGANFGTTHNENLMVYITVQNLYAITLVVLIIQSLNILRVCPETPIHARFWLFFGGKNGKFLNCYFPRNAITQN